jgi:hypothetical protein
VRLRLARIVRDALPLKLPTCTVRPLLERTNPRRKSDFRSWACERTVRMFVGFFCTVVRRDRCALVLSLFLCAFSVRVAFRPGRMFDRTGLPNWLLPIVCRPMVFGMCGFRFAAGLFGGGRRAGGLRIGVLRVGGRAGLRRAVLTAPVRVAFRIGARPATLDVLPPDDGRRAAGLAPEGVFRVTGLAPGLRTFEVAFGRFRLRVIGFEPGFFPGIRARPPWARTAGRFDVAWVGRRTPPPRDAFGAP